MPETACIKCGKLKRGLFMYCYSCAKEAGLVNTAQPHTVRKLQFTARVIYLLASGKRSKKELQEEALAWGYKKGTSQRKIVTRILQALSYAGFPIVSHTVEGGRSFLYYLDKSWMGKFGEFTVNKRREGD